jgi:glucose/arabinose dehydrogenase
MGLHHAFGFAFAFALFAAAPTRAIAYPPNFTDNLYVSGLSEPVAMAWTPDGRLFVAQRNGQVRVVQGGVLQPTAAITLSVETFEEQGLLGMAFHPQFPESSHVYLLYTRNVSGSLGGNHRISRFDVSGNTFVTASEKVLHNTLPIGPNGWHVAGCLRVTPDRMIFATVGDNGHGTGVTYARSLTRLEGKLIRITTAGAIPPDNPFVGVASAKGEIWHRGFRNPFRFAIQPTTGMPFICDVGEVDWEEINFGPPGLDFGWPNDEGVESSPSAGATNPKYAYRNNGGDASISGAAFYDRPGFPAGYWGNFFFLDHSRGHIGRMVLDANNNVVSVTPAWGNTVTAGWNQGPVDLSVGPDGALYYTSYSPGSVRRVSYTGTVGVDPATHTPIALGAASPNPFSASTRIDFTLSAAEETRLLVLDLVGRNIRTLVADRLPGGRHTVAWDGRDDEGNRVSAGIYLVRLASASQVRTRRIVLIR